MKKLLLLMLILGTTSCSKMNDKINLQNYASDIKELKEENKSYDSLVWVLADKQIDAQSLQALSGKMELDITYKELLEKAKKKAVQTRKELDEYYSELKAMNGIFTIKVLDGTFKEGDMNDWYETKLYIENNSENSIVAFEGDIIYTNENGDIILDDAISESFEIPSKYNFETTNNTPAIPELSANKIELKALPFSKITWKWIPDKIIFKDGSRLEATKPIILY